MAPDGRLPRSIEQLQRSVKRSLDRLEVRLHDIFDGGAPDPDAFLRQLDAERTQLDNLLSDLTLTLDGLSDVGAVQLNRVAGQLLEDALIDLEKPLVIRAAWAPELPLVVVPPDLLAALLERLLSIVVRAVAPGDALTIETHREDPHAIFRLRVGFLQSGRLENDREALTLRCRSLAEFVHDLGGEFAVGHDEELRLELRLPLAVGRTA